MNLICLKHTKWSFLYDLNTGIRKKAGEKRIPQCNIRFADPQKLANPSQKGIQMKSNTQNAKIAAITEKTLIIGIDVGSECTMHALSTGEDMNSPESRSLSETRKKGSRRYGPGLRS